eukprot:CAMPEP_0179040178 /NCGR_PEP_ID=MMETSP0796-20121207/15514_1 /TAXON_ID=73915 /ORGANISM="Pyrodinium bahamense, Strain pbaha01" /LENGTH=605 /DNA_ID=CAMNT_0020736517 /DNA_START=64 /DNA_END=1881 /DNA_ORIENTATION=-
MLVALSSPYARLAALLLVSLDFSQGAVEVATGPSGSGDPGLALAAADDECLALGDAGGDEGARCALSALQRRGLKATTARSSDATPKCGGLNEPENAICRSPASWAARGGKNDPHAGQWYAQMKEITGVDYHQGTEQDFQRLFFCSPPGGKACGLPPCTCSHPPCHTCLGGEAPKPKRPGCEEDSTSIACVPPAKALDYMGAEWPTMSLPGTDEIHVFAIGDWGGMDGSLNPIEGRPQIIAYHGGNRPGPSVFPRTRWNKRHSKELCTHKQFIECFNTHGQPPCAEGCGFVAGIDDQPQLLVAKALIARAAEKDPKFLVNVGDNFYWGGIEKTCGTPMDEISYTAHHQFDQIFETIYNGPGLDGKPWLSVLGNHDWGGRVFNNGWDQQIAYTWASPRWVMPAPYWSTTTEFSDQGFSIEMFFVDSNFVDAKDPPLDSEHNICGSRHNPPNADCTVAGGPSSIETCKDWFQDLWVQQQGWLTQKLPSSQADWQFVVTHFPCGHEQPFYQRMHGMGLDLLITGHRHDQEIWFPTDYAKNHMGGLTCLVTGGGGGITSEATPNASNTVDWYGEAEYGFYDLTITKSQILIQSINWNGSNVLNATVYPS